MVCMGNMFNVVQPQNVLWAENMTWQAMTITNRIAPFMNDSQGMQPFQRPKSWPHTLTFQYFVDETNKNIRIWLNLYSRLIVFKGGIGMKLAKTESVTNVITNEPRFNLPGFMKLLLPSNICNKVTKVDGNENLCVCKERYHISKLAHTQPATETWHWRALPDWMLIVVWLCPLTGLVQGFQIVSIARLSLSEERVFLVSAIRSARWLEIEKYLIICSRTPEQLGNRWSRLTDKYI